ncbi:MAG: DNA repair protein RecN [Candidatus Azobacteroides sp.]|nr:DNA repair protein RecN [Candidatus Azobacteroides sp.]
MLQTLVIQNYALISKLEISFPSGFSVITGETGAGKSILLGALSLILGQRADAKSIKQNEDRCVIEGVFDISSYQLDSLFSEKGWEYDARQCILRREIRASGNSRTFINDSPVGLNDLKELGAFLIDIHSQHQNLLLADNQFQMQVLDVLAKNREVKNEYLSTYREYIRIEKEINELKENINTRKTEEDYLRFQFNQLEEARLQTGEQDLLEQESETLSHVEEIKNGLFRLEQFFSSEMTGIVPALKESLKQMQSLQKVYSALEPMVERIETAYLDLKDLATDIHARQENLEFNPERLQEINDRLNILYSLQQKHRLDSVEDLIELRDNLNKQILEIDHSGEALEQLGKKSAQLHDRITATAEKLSQTRNEAAQTLEKQLVKTVSLLGMPNIRFTVEIKRKESFDSNGRDQITYLFSANKNLELKPVAQTASGGEISRLMLGIKSLIAGAMALPTIIFDEIDTGVSGEIADKMGDIMHQMGETMQVIAISHLPQIIAKGETQYLVYKEENNNLAETRIRRLSYEERIKEIAQLLSGAKLTSAAVENAKELLKINKKD